jgi:ketosteroid isomerase-like protein
MSDATSNKDHVRDLIERWADAVCRGDMEGVLASHSPDIVMFDVPEPAQCKGLPAYRQTWQLFFAENGAGPERFRLRELEIHAGDEVAVAYGLLAIAGGSVLCRLTIGLRQVQGNWVVCHEHHSMPISLG